MTRHLLGESQAQRTKQHVANIANSSAKYSTIPCSVIPGPSLSYGKKSELSYGLLTWPLLLPSLSLLSLLSLAGHLPKPILYSSNSIPSFTLCSSCPGSLDSPGIYMNLTCHLRSVQAPLFRENSEKSSLVVTLRLSWSRVLSRLAGDS